MKKIFICSPYRGDVKKNIENVKRYCTDAGWDGIPIAPHLYFTQFLDDSRSSDRYRGTRWGLMLLEECDEVRVYADEVSEGMIEEINAAKKKNIPIKFFNSEMEEIKYESLIINKRIGIGYRQIIEDTYNPGGGSRICPYATDCGGSCNGSGTEGGSEAGTSTKREKFRGIFKRR